MWVKLGMLAHLQPMHLSVILEVLALVKVGWSDLHAHPHKIVPIHIKLFSQIYFSL